MMKIVLVAALLTVATAEEMTLPDTSAGPPSPLKAEHTPMTSDPVLVKDPETVALKADETETMQTAEHKHGFGLYGGMYGGYGGYGGYGYGLGYGYPYYGLGYGYPYYGYGMGIWG